MRGSDTIMFSSESKDLVDGYVLDDLVKPFTDTCQSWTLLNYTIDSEFIIFEASRDLDTGDTQDRALVDDKEGYLSPTRVIAAWGDSATPSFHGANFAIGTVRFFIDGDDDLYESFASTMLRESEGSFDLKANDFVVPEEETTYIDICIDTDELMSQGVPMDQDLHLIGIEDMIDPRARKHVHHFVVSATSVPFNSSQSCDDDFELGDLVYMWAPGSVPSQPPSNVGIPFGGSAGYVALQIEIHYNNPSGIQGLLDSSGVRVYYTSKLREMDMGVLAVGDPSVELEERVLSKKGGLTQHGFTCPSDCTGNYFTQPVTVFSEMLHMHENGKSISNEQIRKGEVIRSGVGQYYEFEAQGGLMVAQKPFEVQPGDAFRTTCTFDAQPGEKWGLASSDEMCIAYLLYYPKQDIPIADEETGLVVARFQPICGVGFDEFLPGCGSEYAITPDFNSVDQIDRDFGTENGVCGIGGPTSSSSLLSSYLLMLVYVVALLFIAF